MDGTGSVIWTCALDGDEWGLVPVDLERWERIHKPRIRIGTEFELKEGRRIMALGRVTRMAE